MKAGGCLGSSQCLIIGKDLRFRGKDPDERYQIRCSERSRETFVVYLREVALDSLGREIILNNLDLDANMRCIGNGIFMWLGWVSSSLAGSTIAPRA